MLLAVCGTLLHRDIVEWKYIVAALRAGQHYWHTRWAGADDGSPAADALATHSAHSA